MTELEQEIINEAVGLISVKVGSLTISMDDPKHVELSEAVDMLRDRGTAEHQELLRRYEMQLAYGGAFSAEIVDQIDTINGGVRLYLISDAWVGSIRVDINRAAEGFQLFIPDAVALLSIKEAARIYDITSRFLFSLERAK